MHFSAIYLLIKVLNKFFFYCVLIDESLISGVMYQIHFASNKFVRVRFFFLLSCFIFAWDLINESKTSQLRSEQMNNKSKGEICQGRNICFLQALQHDWRWPVPWPRGDGRSPVLSSLFICCSNEGEQGAF